MSRPIPSHGTPARYKGRQNLPGCRCRPCTTAASRADAERRLDRLAGNSRTADAATAQRVVKHLRDLAANDMSHAQIAASAGVAQSTVSDLIAGRTSPLSKNATKLLQVRRTDRTDTCMVSAVGAKRRLQALYWMRHPSRVVASETGLHEDTVLGMARGRYGRTTAARVQRVCEAYDRLAMRYGSSEFARRFAVGNGWHGPLAWDEDTIDDPAASPVLDVVPDPDEDFVDPVAVQRFVVGAPVTVTDAEWLVALKECVARGMSYPQVDELRGAEKGTTEKSVNRLRKAYTRAGRELPEALRPTKVGTFADRQVVEIRERYAAGGTSDLELSMRYGVSRETITSLLSGDTYRAVGGPIREKRSSRPTETSRVEFNMHTGFGRAIDVAQAS